MKWQSLTFGLVEKLSLKQNKKAFQSMSTLIIVQKSLTSSNKPSVVTLQVPYKRQVQLKLQCLKWLRSSKLILRKLENNIYHSTLLDSISQVKERECLPSFKITERQNMVMIKEFIWKELQKLFSQVAVTTWTKMDKKSNYKMRWNHIFFRLLQITQNKL